MGLMNLVVLCLIGFGLLVSLIWLVRALTAYPHPEAALSPAAAVEHDLSGHASPPKLSWNWGAFFLGPIWYFMQGLWVYAIILICLIVLSGGILWPFVMLYSGLKANETLEDARLARHTVY
jgi:hypothetical protein